MTKLILIGTGTPNPDPYRMGPSVGILYKSKMYVFDVGTGIIRRLNQIAYQLDGFKINQITHAFITHLHSDHTLGLSDLLLTPWVLGRKEPLNLYGPRGLKDMVSHIKAAYQVDIHERIHGLEKANESGIQIKVTEIEPGTIINEDIKIEALPVNHGNFEAYAYKITTPDKIIVISGDTAPCDAMVEFSKGCDILVHEVYYAEGLKSRSEQWQKYHSNVHTSAIELGKLAQIVQPKKLVLYHQLFMQEMILDTDMTKNNQIYKDKILNEIQLAYNGSTVYGEDLMIIE